MAMFAMETSFLIALAVFAGGLALLHFGRQAGAGLLRAAGFVLLVGSVLTAACTLYWGIRYHVQGDFEHAYPMGPRGMHGERGGPGMMGHEMRHEMMGPGGERHQGAGRGPGAGPHGGMGMMSPAPGAAQEPATPAPSEPEPAEPR